MASSIIRPAGEDSQVYSPGQTGRNASPWVGITIEMAGSQLDGFLYDGKPRPAADTAAATDSRPAREQHDCIHCGAKLSAVERKMERCLSCGKDVRHTPGTADAEAVRRQVTVGI